MSARQSTKIGRQESISQAPQTQPKKKGKVTSSGGATTYSAHSTSTTSLPLNKMPLALAHPRHLPILKPLTHVERTKIYKASNIFITVTPAPPDRSERYNFFDELNTQNGSHLTIPSPSTFRPLAHMSPAKRAPPRTTVTNTRRKVGFLKLTEIEHAEIQKKSGISVVVTPAPQVTRSSPAFNRGRLEEDKVMRF